MYVCMYVFIYTYIYNMFVIYICLCLSLYTYIENIFMIVELFAGIGEEGRRKESNSESYCV
jgi:hypothetical protein